MTKKADKPLLLREGIKGRRRFLQSQLRNDIPYLMDNLNAQIAAIEAELQAAEAAAQQHANDLDNVSSLPN